LVGSEHLRRSAFAAVLVGAALLIWPAFFNGYPLLFSDSGGFLHQTLGPLMLWDKPYVYGPFLHLFHWRVSLWGPLAAQAAIVSHLLWLTQRCIAGAASPRRHLAVTAFVAAATTAPFSVALLMPDIFAPVVVLALVLLGAARARLGRGERVYLVALATAAIAVHLSHLPLAAATIAALATLDMVLRRPRGAWPLLLSPLAAAIAVLVATNAVGHGKPGLSPHGATFLLARLQSDGPATATLRARCPQAGWYLCDFVDRLPMDSDVFLWAADSPVNRDAAGRQRFLGGALLSAEASQIVGETLRRDPLGVAGAMLRNTAVQLAHFGIGDTLGNDWLSVTVARRLADGFPPREAAAFAGAPQARGELRATLSWADLAVLPAILLALPALAYAAIRAARDGDRAALALALCVALGIVANAAIAGGLSKPHARYQARIVWLLPAAAVLLLLPRAPAERR
jgi:hypothetical protein